MRSPAAPQWSTSAAVLRGIGVSLACFVFVLLLGLLFAQWSITDFFANFSLGMLLELLALVALVILTLGVPIVAYLRLRLVYPILALVPIFMFWVVIGIGGSTIGFGLALYALWLAPVYVMVYFVLGAVELFLHW